LGKVSRALIGTQGAQTEPWAISELAKLGKNRERLKLIISATGTFHPKVIVGRRGSDVRAIIGSTNFTCAGFGANTELDVLLEGDASEAPFRQLKTYLAEHWQRGVSLEDDWLAKYTLAWEAAKRRPTFVPLARLDLSTPGSLDLEWVDFVRWIESQEGRKLKSGYELHVRGPSARSYFAELENAAAIFANGKPFADLSQEDRHLLMGVGSESTGLIGSMRPAGYARELVNKHPEKIGVHLDRLPIKGPVSLQLASEIVEGMTQHKGVKVGVASRFLTVKRPDLFVSVNNGSKPSLANLLHRTPTWSAKEYIQLLQVVWGTRWHNSPRPAVSADADLWDRRAALLDAALYEEV
jgi:hypothetical protein